MEEFIRPPVPPLDTDPTPEERSYAMWVHLSAFLGYLIGPLGVIMPVILWTSRRGSLFIDDHGREAVNYNISIWIYTMIAGLLVMAAGLGCLLLPAIVIFDIIVKILAATRATAGMYYRYPITIRFIGG